MGYNIGFFKATDTGYTGKIETLASRSPSPSTGFLIDQRERARLRNLHCGDLRIGAAWERRAGPVNTSRRQPSRTPAFSSGYYNLYRKTGVEDGYKLSFERPFQAEEGQGD
jgi:uncharacterized protein (DUF736 family)